MPYSGEDDPKLPDHVKEMPAKKRRQWMHVFNSSMEDGDDEETAFAKANGVSNKSYIEGYEIYGRQINQEQANYNAVGGDNEKACANCRWFVSPDGCILVGGIISPTGVSSYWMEKPKVENIPIPVTIVSDSSEINSAGDPGNIAVTRPPLVQGVVNHIIDFAKGLFGIKQETGFMLFKDSNDRLRFFAMPSNMFEDRQKHIVTSEAHKDYVNWVEATGLYPELWMWHVPGSRIGECDWLDFTDGGVLCASGVIDKEFEGIALGLVNKDIAMSHGFFRFTDLPHIGKYRSFEISVLPRSNAANFGTDFLVEQKEMPFTDQKRKFFTEAGIPEETIKSWEDNADKVSSQLKQMGVAWKEGEESQQEAQQESQQNDIQALTSAVLALTDKVTSLESGLTPRIEAVEKSFDDKVAEAMQSKIATSPQGFKPSESVNNQIAVGEGTKQAEDSLNWFYGEVISKVGGN